MDFLAALPARGVGLSIERFDPHARHQGAEVSAAGLETLTAQQIVQQAGAGEGGLQMPLVDPAH